MNDLTEIVSCHLCNDTKYEHIYDAPDRLMKVAGSFQIVRCQSCGLIYLSPRPTLEEIGKYYPESYEPYLKHTPQSLPFWRRWLLEYGLWKRSRPILQHKAKGHMLDVGSATGQFLAYLRDKGDWQVKGVEPNTMAAQYARKAFGLDIHVGGLRSAHFPEDYFDAVTMWDVLEHLHEPLAELREVQRILKPDGIFLFRVPSYESLGARLFGPFWAGLDVPRHMLVFSRQTLTQMLARAGFQPRRIWCASGSYFAFVLSWRMLIEAKVWSPMLRQLLIRGVSNPIFRALSVPYFWISDRLGYGSSMTVIAHLIGKSK